MPHSSLTPQYPSLPVLDRRILTRRTLPDLRDQLVVALAPLAPHLSTLPPTDPSDIQLWDDRFVEGAEGDQGIRALLTEDESMMTIKELGWGRWKRLYLR